MDRDKAKYCKKYGVMVSTNSDLCSSGSCIECFKEIEYQLYLQGVVLDPRD